MTEEPAVIEFLAEFYQVNRPFNSSLVKKVEEESTNYLQAKQKLLSFIENSKTKAHFASAAANAITLLNSAGVPLFFQDFKNARIPGADLRSSICDLCDFENADLRNVNFQEASLGMTNFRGARMEGVDFGQFPEIRLEEDFHHFSFSKDGQMLAIATGWEVQIYNIYTRELLQTVAGRNARINAVSFVPNDQSKIVSTHQDNTIRVSDIKSGQTEKTIKHPQRVGKISLSRDGKYLESNGLWNTESWTLEKTFDNFPQSSDTCFSPDGELLAFVSGGSIKILNIARWEIQKSFQPSKGTVYSVAFSPNGEQLASVTGGRGWNEDNTLTLWNVETGQLKWMKEEAHNNRVADVCFSPNGEQIGTGSADDTVRLWGTERGDLQTTFEGHSGQQVGFSPNGELIVSAGFDKTVQFWTVGPQNQQKRVQDSKLATGTHACFSPDGKQLATVSDQGIQFWEVTRGQCLPKTFHAKGVRGLCFSPDGKWLASAGTEMRFWDLSCGSFKVFGDSLHDRVDVLAFSPDGELLATVDLGTISVWDVKTGKLHKSLEGHTWAINSICFSPNGKQLGSGSVDKSVRVWNVLTGECQYNLKTRGDALSVSFSPNGEVLASGHDDYAVRLWNLKTGKLQQRLETHESSVHKVSFNSNGKILASAGGDGNIHCRAMNNLDIFVQTATYSSVHWLAWHPCPSAGEDYFVTGHADSSMRYWRFYQETLTPDLIWTNRRPSRLNVSNSTIADAIGLSFLNTELLKQRGAV